MSHASSPIGTREGPARARQSTEVAGSFRDPSGIVFRVDGRLYRQVNRSYRRHYDLLLQSGLYESLVADGLLVPHQEVSEPTLDPAEAYRILEPEPVPFVSYPHEWCFGQLKAAALAVLAVQRRALGFGMTLKDASAYNVQFRGSRPVLIDTLSFERHQEGRPWVAYRQFCQHFLAPLALMSRQDPRLGQLFRVYVDGIPLDLASRLLPWASWLVPSLLVHLHLHARLEMRYRGRAAAGSGRRMNRQVLLALVEGLEGAISRLNRPRGRSPWASYYHDSVYGPEGLDHKEALLASILEQVQPAMVWDLGASTGRFSRLASRRGIPTVAFDLDGEAIEQSYQQARQEGDACLLPLVLDLANPSAGLGWAGRELMALSDRGPADLVLALALTHHLALTHNVPFPLQAAYLRQLGRWLAVEFVPPQDPQAQLLLERKPSLAARYDLERFLEGFGRHFEVVRRDPIGATGRTLYLLRRR